MAAGRSWAEAGARRPFLRLEGGCLAPAPARHGGVLEDLGARLGVVNREPRSPLDVCDQRRAELGIVWQAGVVGGEAEQRREPKSLLGRDREPAVVGEHALVATELLGVARGTAEHLRPPGGDVRAVVLAHP